MNVIIPIWQWIMENRFEMERIIKTILHYFVADVEVIEYFPTVKFFVE